MERRYDATRDRAEVAARSGRTRGPSTSPNPDPGAEPDEALLPARDAPVPVGDAAHGARPQLHDGRRPHALPPPQRLARAAPDGLRLVRPARRERRDPRGRPPARDHRAEHRARSAARCSASAGRSTGTARSPRTSPTYYRWTQWLFLKLLRGRARLPQGGAGQLVPERPDRARERAGDRRPLRALRRRGRARGTWSSGSSGSPRTPTSCSTTSTAARLARADEDDPAQLDRPLRGRGDPLPRSRSWTSTSRSSRRGPTRSSARPSSCSRPSIRSSSGWPSDADGDECASTSRRAGKRGRGARRRPRRRPASSPASTPSNPVNGEPHPDLGRRLRADGLRHRRDHGRARRTTSATASSPSASTCRSAVVASIDEDGRATLVEHSDASARRLGEFSACRAEGEAAIVEWLARARPRRARGQLPPARLGLLAPALLGLPDPDRLLRRDCGIVPVPEDELPVLLPEVEDYRPKGKPPLASNEEWVNVAVPEVRRRRRSARPTRWTRSSTRPGTSCATATRTTTRRRSTARLVDYWLPGRPVHRRRSTTRPGTCSTRASSSRR